MSGLTLVTGASGFIGPHLVKGLLAEGRAVRCLIRYDDDRLALEGCDVEIVKGDIRDPGLQRQAVNGVDTVFHLAAQARPDRFIYNRRQLRDIYDETNTAATVSLASQCRQRVRSFVYFSSIAAAGVSRYVTEEMPPAPQTEYGKSKQGAEVFLKELYQKEGFPVKIVRPGTTYGPGHRAMGILLKFIKNGLFPSFGPGKNLHSFIYVKNLIDATLLVEEHGKCGEIYFCIDEAVAIRDFARIIAENMGRSLTPFYIPRSLAVSAAMMKEAVENILRVRIFPFCMDLGLLTVMTASSDWECSNKKIKNELGFIPKIDMKTGTQAMIQWYQEQGLL